MTTISRSLFRCRRCQRHYHLAVDPLADKQADDNEILFVQVSTHICGPNANGSIAYGIGDLVGFDCPSQLGADDNGSL